MISEKNKAIVALLLVSGIYVILSIVARVLADGFGDFTQVYIRILLGALLAVLIFNRHINWQKYRHLSKKDWLGLSLMGIIGYGVVVATITVGAINTSLVNVSVIYSTLPFFTYLYSLFVFRKKPTLAPLLLLAFSFWGVTIILENGFVPRLTSVGRGDVFVLISAASGAWYVIGRKLTSNYLNNREMSVLVMLLAGITTLVCAMLAGETINWSAFGMVPIILGLVVGALLNIVATFLENYGFKKLDEVFASQLLLMENVFALVLGFAFYRETITLVQSLGVAIVVASVWLATKRKVLDV